jgi:hypothetical protein
MGKSNQTNWLQKKTFSEIPPERQSFHRLISLGKPPYHQYIDVCRLSAMIDYGLKRSDDHGQTGQGAPKRKRITPSNSPKASLYEGYVPDSGSPCKVAPYSALAGTHRLRQARRWHQSLRRSLRLPGSTLSSARCQLPFGKSILKLMKTQLNRTLWILKMENA